MKQILGFSVISALVDNVPEAMSLLGELSTQAATYSMTKGEYTNPLNPGYRLETFSVKDPVSGLDTTLTSEEALLAIAVTKACVDYAATAPIPVNPQDFRMAIAADFIDVIDSLEFGELLTASGTTLPTWFSFTAKAGVRNEYKIWLADSAFLIQYPEYDVKVVPPMPELNLFLGNWQNAVNALAEWPNTALIEAVGAAANLQPYSYLSYYEFDFVNRLNPAQKHKTSWYVLTYGEAGNNEDIHKDAIIDLLVKTTGRPEADWMPIFPELFKRTEFVGYPRWDRMSIPNASTLTGLYSSILYLQNSIDYAVQRTTFYPEEFVKQNALTFPLTYKAIAVVMVNGLNNLDSMKRLEELWPDYIPVPTTSPDFQRMQIKTRGWVNFMLRLVEAAETATTISALPQGIRRVKRGDTWFLSASYERASYMLAARYNETYEYPDEGV